MLNILWVLLLVGAHSTHLMFGPSQNEISIGRQLGSINLNVNPPVVEPGGFFGSAAIPNNLVVTTQYLWWTDAQRSVFRRDKATGTIEQVVTGGEGSPQPLTLGGLAVSSDSNQLFFADNNTIRTVDLLSKPQFPVRADDCKVVFQNEAWIIGNVQWDQTAHNYLYFAAWNNSRSSILQLSFASLSHPVLVVGDLNKGLNLLPFVIDRAGVNIYFADLGGLVGKITRLSNNTFSAMQKLAAFQLALSSIALAESCEMLFIASMDGQIASIDLNGTSSPTSSLLTVSTPIIFSLLVNSFSSPSCVTPLPILVSYTPTSGSLGAVCNANVSLPTQKNSVKLVKSVYSQFAPVTDFVEMDAKMKAAYYTGSAGIFFQLNLSTPQLPPAPFAKNVYQFSINQDNCSLNYLDTAGLWRLPLNNNAPPSSLINYSTLQTDEFACSIGIASTIYSDGKETFFQPSSAYSGIIRKNEQKNVCSYIVNSKLLDISFLNFFNPETRQIFGLYGGGTNITAIHVDTGLITPIFLYPQYARGLAFDFSTNRLFTSRVTLDQQGNVSFLIIDYVKNSTLAEIPLFAYPRGFLSNLVYHKASNSVLFTAWFGFARTYRISTVSPFTIYRTHLSPRSYAAPIGSVDEDSGLVYFVDTSCVHSFDLNAVSASGHSTNWNRVYCIDTAAQELAATYQPTPLKWFQFSKDKSFLYYTTPASTLVRVNVQNGSLPTPVQGNFPGPYPPVALLIAEDLGLFFCSSNSYVYYTNFSGSSFGSNWTIAGSNSYFNAPSGLLIDNVQNQLLVSDITGVWALSLANINAPATRVWIGTKPSFFATKGMSIDRVRNYVYLEGQSQTLTYLFVIDLRANALVTYFSFTTGNIAGTWGFYSALSLLVRDVSLSSSVTDQYGYWGSKIDPLSPANTSLASFPLLHYMQIASFQVDLSQQFVQWTWESSQFPVPSSRLLLVSSLLPSGEIGSVVEVQLAQPSWVSAISWNLTVTANVPFIFPSTTPGIYKAYFSGITSPRDGYSTQFPLTPFHQKSSILMSSPIIADPLVLSMPIRSLTATWDRIFSHNQYVAWLTSSWRIEVFSEPVSSSASFQFSFFVPPLLPVYGAATLVDVDLYWPPSNADGTLSGFPTAFWLMSNNTIIRSDYVNQVLTSTTIFSLNSSITIHSLAVDSSNKLIYLGYVNSSRSAVFRIDLLGNFVEFLPTVLNVAHNLRVVTDSTLSCY